MALLAHPTESESKPLVRVRGLFHTFYRTGLLPPVAALRIRVMCLRPRKLNAVLRSTALARAFCPLGRRSDSSSRDPAHGFDMPLSAAPRRCNSACAHSASYCRSTCLGRTGKQRRNPALGIQVVPYYAA